MEFQAWLFFLLTARDPVSALKSLLSLFLSEMLSYDVAFKLFCQQNNAIENLANEGNLESIKCQFKGSKY